VHVTGPLAQPWPPLVATAPTESGATGSLSVASGAHPNEVRYNGHFLYTFVDDTPGQVTGQGVQGFAVATPDLPSTPGSAAPTPAVSQPGGYGGY
jgi:predicted lipoprotein with Yx(FWY)xxD motif